MPDEEGRLAAPRGTRDLLPPESWEREQVIRLALDTFGAAGYAPIETPIFEHTELFERGVGATTEVVGKQMYTFNDRGGRSLTLRPEGTAPVMRAVLEHNLHRGSLPLKLSYAGSMFRQERPQRGRHRQFFQVGIEAIGTDDPRADAEVIEVGTRFYRLAGVDTKLLLNSIGHPGPDCRLAFVNVLLEYLEPHAEGLGEEDRERMRTNPLRTFDSRDPKTQRVLEGAPVITEHLCAGCRSHFEEVTGMLDDVGVEFTLQPRLVRGLDYYTRTAFEWIATGLGSQDAVGGGGRYDGLSESLGGPPLPGVGIAPGIDRIMLARKAESPASLVSVYVVAVGEEARRETFRLVTQLRVAGVGVDFDVMGRGLKGQMKDASRSGARWAVIVGDAELRAAEATLKNLDSGEQERIPLSELAGRIS